MEVQVIKRRISPGQLRKRKEIIESAAKMIDRQGANFSMEKLADASSTSRSTLYRYFTSREHLIAEVTLASGNKLIEHLEKLPKQGQTLGENITAMCERISEFASQNYSLLTVGVRNLASEDPAVMDAQDEIEQLVSGMIKSVVGNQALPNADVIDKTVFRYLLGAFLLTTSGKLSFEQLSEDLVALCHSLMHDVWDNKAL